jgi:hypothetical protein
MPVWVRNRRTTRESQTFWQRDHRLGSCSRPRCCTDASVPHPDENAPCQPHLKFCKNETAQSHINTYGHTRMLAKVVCDITTFNVPHANSAVRAASCHQSSRGIKGQIDNRGIVRLMPAPRKTSDPISVSQNHKDRSDLELAQWSGRIR